MVPFWGRCPPSLVYFSGDWDGPLRFSILSSAWETELGDHMANLKKTKTSFVGRVYHKPVKNHKLGNLLKESQIGFVDSA